MDHSAKGPPVDLQKISLKIGEYEVHPIPTGIFGLDGGAMFGTVPKVLWEKAIPADEKNRIPMEARALLLKSPKRNILIDCGNGSDFIAKYGDKLGNQFAEMYNVKNDGPSLFNSLAKYGLSPNDITDVIFSHLHFDHCGGGTRSENGVIVPSFTNAKYYVQKANYETALKPSRRERASYFSVNFQSLLDHKLLHFLEGEHENFIPQISVSLSNGHTLGQQTIKISDEKTTLIFCADLIPTSAHVRLSWIMGYDLNPLCIIEEKQKLLEQAAENSWYLFFEHDSNVDLCTVENKGSDFAVAKRFKLD
jgi:glyoxylase-like metal-dependent hydrolase (beta-lactamase superfamily II)